MLILRLVQGQSHEDSTHVNFLNFFGHRLNHQQLPNVERMGAGGSTDSRSSPVTVISLPKRHQSAEATVKEQPKSFGNHESGTREDPKSAQSLVHSHAPTERCCSHYKRNHAQHSAGHSAQQKFDQNSLDEDIEEIVANTLDLPGTNSDTDIRRVVVRDSQNAISPNGSSRSRTRIPLAGDSAETIKKPSVHDESQIEEETNDDTKECFPEVDFAKFKKVNHKDPPAKRNGKTILHQDSDLLWRLGLISPEAYTLKKATRSAPSVHGGDFLKPPSYDLTEEQLMVNIEKEFAEYTATV